MGDNINDINNIQEEKLFNRTMIAVIIATIVICILIVTCTIMYITNRNEQARVDTLLNNITTIANVRYTGYTEDVVEAIYSSCEAEYAEQVDKQLEIAYSNNGLYDITEFMQNVTHEDSSRHLSEAIVLTDTGKYCIDLNYLRDLEPDGQLKEYYDLECYDETYHFDTSLIPYDPSLLIGNEDYKFSIADYSNTDNVFEVEFESGALEFDTIIKTNTEDLIDAMTVEDFINDEV